jgi:thioredoxin reductase
MSAEPDDIDVLIVGAGPVSLASAIELGHRGSTKRVICV